MKGKRRDIQRHGNSTVQTAFVVNQFVKYPGCGTSTNNQLIILSGKAPVVAEMLESEHEIGLWRIHPGKLVNKDYLTIPVVLFAQ